MVSYPPELDNIAKYSYYCAIVLSKVIHSYPLDKDKIMI